MYLDQWYHLEAWLAMLGISQQVKSLQVALVLFYLSRQVSRGYRQMLLAPFVCVLSPPLASVSMPRAWQGAPLSFRLPSVSEREASWVATSRMAFNEKQY